MSNILDRAGTFRGKPMEWAVSQTQKGYPQFVAKLSALEIFADTPELMAHFGITEAGWADWSSYDQETVGYFVLFNDKGPLLNYEQVQKALGWDGTSFAGLAAGDWSDKMVLFRVEESEWEGKTSLKVQWIDEPDAPPNRQLRALDPAKLVALDGQFAGMMTKKAVVAAKAPAKAPAAAPAVATKAPPAGKPVAAAVAKAPAFAPAAKSAAAPTSQATTAKVVSTTTAPSSKGPPAAPKATKAVAAAAVAEVDKLGAWKFLAENKGTKSDEDLGKAWVDAYTAIAPDIEEDALSNAQWTQIRDHAAKLLSIVA